MWRFACMNWGWKPLCFNFENSWQMKLKDQLNFFFLIQELDLSTTKSQDGTWLVYFHTYSNETWNLSNETFPGLSGTSLHQSLASLHQIIKNRECRFRVRADYPQPESDSRLWTQSGVGRGFKIKKPADWQMASGIEAKASTAYLSPVRGLWELELAHNHIQSAEANRARSAQPLKKNTRSGTHAHTPVQMVREARREKEAFVEKKKELKDTKQKRSTGGSWEWNHRLTTR